jgi:hypothetical protein
MPSLARCVDDKQPERRGLTPGAEEELDADVSDPTGLAGARGDFLKATATHQQKKDILLAVECLTASSPEGGFPLFGCALDAIGVLLVVDFEISLGMPGEIASDDEAANPGLRHVAIGEPVSKLAVDAKGADAGVGRYGKEKLRPRKNDPVAHGTGGVIERELRINGDGEGGFRCVGLLFSCRCEFFRVGGRCW